MGKTQPQSELKSEKKNLEGPIFVISFRHKKNDLKEIVSVNLFDVCLIVEPAARNNSHLQSEIKYSNPIGQKYAKIVVLFPTISFQTGLNCRSMCDLPEKREKLRLEHHYLMVKIQYIYICMTIIWSLLCMYVVVSRQCTLHTYYIIRLQIPAW